MEFNSQIYRAPSLPKMNRRNISSSVMSGAQAAAAPKLRRSSFSFIGAGRAKVASGLKVEKADIGTQLDETNRILVEIQKQLSLDFANRIVEKRQALKAYKTQVSRQRAASKESAIESMRNSGAGLLKVFEKVAAPAKGIFQRILDFFSIILTGLLVNNAFKWLEDPANRAKLEKFFNFVVNHWKELLALYGAYKLIKIVSALKRIADLFKKPPKWRGGGGKGGGKGGGPSGPTGCGAIAACGGSILKVIKDNSVAIAAILAGALGTFFQPLTGAPAFGKPVEPPSDIPSKDDPNLYPPQLRPFMQWATGWRRTEAGQKIEELEATVGLLTAAFGGVQGLKGLRGVKGAKGAVQSPGVSLYSNKNLNAQELAALGLPAKSTTSAGDIINIVRSTMRSKPKVKSSTGGTIPGLSGGGTVGGTGSGFVDSVAAMLAPGEEVIRASAAMLFRPLLKDINNNAGRLWTSFSGAIVTLMRSNNELEGGIRSLKEQLVVFKKQLDQFINQEKLKKENSGGGVGQMPRPPRTSMVAPEIVLHSDIKNAPRRRAKSSVIPIQLPPQTLPATNMPKFSAEGGVATEEPDIGSTNPANPYMQLTPRLLGIFV